ncbi:IPT/TIG domain-containing protein [Myxococcota bacterium]|nr:IPT/TIG domain-containing protein [Myxococcota bacterium]MBU1899723.1 IPT/TIG domain-containing protein [Myxococcota bacterium]
MRAPLPHLAHLFGLAALALLGCDAPPQGSPLEVSLARPTPRDALAEVGLDDAGRLNGDASPPDASIRGPLLNSIIPNRAEVSGGASLRLVGRDFTPEARVFLGERPCGDLVFESENHLRCVAPPAPAEVVDVRVEVGDEAGVLAQGFTYFAPVRLSAVSPLASPASGGVEVLLLGEGLLESTQVRFGGVAGTNTRLDEEGGLRVLAPPHAPGAVTLSARNINGEAVLDAPFLYYEALVLSELDPPWGWLAGGESITLFGHGLLADSAARFGDAAAEVVSEGFERQRLIVRAPPAQAPGRVDVEIDNLNGAARLPLAYLYLDPEASGFEVVGVHPDQIPQSGGVEFLLGGAGFTEETTVEVDGARVFCDLQHPQLLRCLAPPHAPGAVDVLARQGAMTRRLEGGLTFFREVDIYQLTPARGAVSGGTWVEIQGAGFTQGMSLRLNGQALQDLVVLDEQRAAARTPPGRLGPANLEILTAEDQGFLEDAFEYFDPYSRFGGVWGDPIGHSINLTVVNAVDDSRVEGASIYVTGPGGVRLSAKTDEAGQASVGDGALRAPLTLSVGKAGFEVSTYERLTHQNLTIFLMPHPSDEDPDPQQGGDPSVGTPSAPAYLSGELRGMSALRKPSEPGFVLAAFVETTHTSIYDRNTLPWPSPSAILLEDGPFSITTRPGELALIAVAGYVEGEALDDYLDGDITYARMRQRFFPLAMGYQRFISASPNIQIDGLEVTLDRPLDQTRPVRLENPSTGFDTAYEIRAFLDFGPEGLWALEPDQVEPLPRFDKTGLPDLAGWDPDISLYWMGIARVDASVWQPYTVTFTRLFALPEEIVIGPFIGTPRMISPEDGGAFPEDRRIAWTTYPGLDGPQEQPHLHVLYIYNGEGLPLWSHTLPGAVMEYTLPDFPPEVWTEEITAGSRLSLTSVRVNGDFDYGDFALRDLTTSRRQSYSVESIRFDP